MKKLSIPTETVTGYTSAPHIHLVGSGQCVVDGLKGIKQYTRESIVIDVGRYCIKVVGVGLCINEFSPEGAIIEGDILSLELTNDG